jgi:hydrogenase nickel incorporation protein HypB
MTEVKVLKNIMDANLHSAERNRARLGERGILAINVMASPGAGKTSIILGTIERLGKEARIGVIEGDIASTVDADKVAARGIPVVQINTGGGCHLDANQIAAALDNLPLDRLDLIFIENVGNLVCPAEFRLGEQKRLVIASTAEGDDKPYKYPIMFTETDAIIINKTDLAPYLDFSGETFKKVVRGLNQGVVIFDISAKTGAGFGGWIEWLRAELKRVKAAQTA